MTGKPTESMIKSCPHCEGRGYTEIRDCTGEIQRSETCIFCNGTGTLDFLEEERISD